jgi:hypothetical protein
MKAPFDFIIEPLGGRYNNSIDVDGKSLILNTEVFNHQYVNREARILSLPTMLKTDLKVGDIVVVHHNIFRRFHDVRGIERNSRSYFKEDKYFVTEDQIFLYKRSDKWQALNGYVFVKPIKNIDIFSESKERPHIGIVKHTDGSQDIGELVGFLPYNEFEFIIDGERFYRVLSKDITIKYEYQGDEEEYNPSWA